MSMYAPTIILVAMLLSVLWVPSCIAARMLKPRLGIGSFLRKLLPLQLVVMALLAFAAERAGLLNPAGYVLAITVAISSAGVLAVVRRHRTAKSSLKPMVQSPTATRVS